MKTLLINASPKGRKGNSYLFARAIQEGVMGACDLIHIAEKPSPHLDADQIIFVLPLYIHSMPGVMAHFLEEMTLTPQVKALGFVVQYGFPEQGQGRYLSRQLEVLTKRLEKDYLGTLLRPNSAGTYMMPTWANKRLFKKLRALGASLDGSAFSADILQWFSGPEALQGLSRAWYLFGERLGLNDFIWNRFLKQNGAYEHRYARPCLEDEK